MIILHVVSVEIAGCNLGMGVMKKTDSLHGWALSMYHSCCVDYTNWQYAGAVVGVWVSPMGHYSSKPNSTIVHYYLNGRYEHSIEVGWSRNEIESRKCMLYPAALGYDGAFTIRAVVPAPSQKGMPLPSLETLVIKSTRD